MADMQEMLHARENHDQRDKPDNDRDRTLKARPEHAERMPDLEEIRGWPKRDA
ncbi:hypothetical protein FHS83_003798 [Rhizomicrobium palustre]|uniref:Uncharacterized protein n=1 Tax=Rhizomicrobium palustre TaxID=189966 RepID=A0A846N665_9PROT|nr:hypothetical protein [Rhizomicrobium palustre]NIK90480.1 hypothetical protein [Rhizomicrobium palustre]